MGGTRLIYKHGTQDFPPRFFRPHRRFFKFLLGIAKGSPRAGGVPSPTRMERLSTVNDPRILPITIAHSSLGGTRRGHRYLAFSSAV